MSRKKRKKKNRVRKRRTGLLIFIGLLLVGGLLLGLGGYLYLYTPSMKPKQQPQLLYLHTDTQLDSLIPILEEAGLQNPGRFRTLAGLMHLEKAKAGRYALKPGLHNRALIRMLRAGLQEPVRLSFISHRTLDEWAQTVAPRFRFSKAELQAALKDPRLLDSLGANPQTLPAYFIPDTYQLYWTTSAKNLVLRMKKEYDRYWTPQRQAQAEALGLTPIEVMTLASIVQAETNRNSEKARVAGVYLNRLRKGMRLEADPTVKFALGDFVLKRILKRHIEATEDNPYNTYRHTGLPPGPINLPEKSSIEAVLGAEQHAYYYFCASAQKVGYHTFSRTLAEHNQAARAYHAWLNDQRIFE
jgi:UPF0755 protein